MVKTTLNREYALRVMAVGVVFAAMCVWSLYDGIRGWPEKNRALEEVRPVLLATNLTAEAWLAVRGEGEESALAAAFESRGHKLPNKLIKKVNEIKLPASEANNPEARKGEATYLNQVFTAPVYSAHDLQGQFVMAGITFLIAVVVLGGVARRARCCYQADERGIKGGVIGGEARPYSDIELLEWELWDEKGIVGVQFKDGLKVRLDGWHHSGVVEIAALLEQQRPDLAQEAAVVGKDGRGRG